MQLFVKFVNGFSNGINEVSVQLRGMMSTNIAQTNCRRQ